MKEKLLGATIGAAVGALIGIGVTRFGYQEKVVETVEENEVADKEVPAIEDVESSVDEETSTETSATVESVSDSTEEQ